jgi:outer membrane protein assembly factor BamB
MSVGADRREVLRIISSGVGIIFGLSNIGNAQEITREDILWQFDSETIDSGPTVVNNTVYFGSNSGSVYAVDAINGEEIWKNDLFELSGGEIVSSSPTVIDNFVYIGSDEGKMYAIGADSGEKQWEYDVFDEVDDHGWIRTSPTVADDTVFFGCTRSFSNEPHDKFHALDADSGSKLWGWGSGDNTGVRSSPTVVDGIVVFGSRENDSENVHALDASSGEVLWEFDAKGSVYASPTISDGTVFIGNRNASDNSDIDPGSVYALDLTSGENLWQYGVDRRIESSPTVVDGTVFIGSGAAGRNYGGSIHALDTDSGEELWRFSIGDDLEDRVYGRSPTVADGTVFAGSESSLYAIDAVSGEQMWSTSVSRPWLNASLLLVDGTLFVVSVNGVHAIETSVDGSSQGSRALLGTIGHHSGWDGEMPSINFSPSAQIHTSEDTPTSIGSDTGRDGNSTQEEPPTESSGDQDSTATDDTEDTDSTGLTSVFRRFSNAPDSIITQLIAGVGSIGLVYGAYKTLNKDSGESTPTDEELNPPESPPVPNTPETKTKTFETTRITYSEIKQGKIIETGEYATIREGTVESHPVWFLMPPQQGGETIPRPVCDHFTEKMDTWIEIDEHPNILSTYQSGEQPIPWVVVERGDYTPIAVRNERTEQQVQKIIFEVCEAIHHVSRYGIIYNGLTTDSILSDGGNSVALRGLLDQFGDTNPWYAAPEEHNGDATERTLVYRVGLSTYELLTGSLPYVGYPDTDPTESINNGVQLHASEAFNELDPDLQETLSRALAPSPTDRHETVLHLRDELNQSSQ